MTRWHTTTSFDVKALDNRTDMPAYVDVCAHEDRALLRVSQYNPDHPDDGDVLILDREAAVVLLTELQEFTGGTTCAVH